jgi:hypothetical protein
VHVELLGEPVPRELDEIVRDFEPVLLERDQIATIVVIIDPAAPHFGVAVASLTAVLRAVFDERADRGVDDAMVVPPCVAKVALEQVAVPLVGERHQQDRVTVADVA